jgi:hypothetical protein
MDGKKDLLYFKYLPLHSIWLHIQQSWVEDLDTLMIPKSLEREYFLNRPLWAFD